MKSIRDIIEAFGIPRSYAHVVSRIDGFTVMPRNSSRNTEIKKL